MLGRVVAVTAEDRVGERFGQGDRDIQHELALPVSHDLAFAAHQLDDFFDVPDVVRDFDVDDPDGTVGRFPVALSSWHP
jgi:hypothetical protein